MSITRLIRSTIVVTKPNCSATTRYINLMTCNHFATNRNYFITNRNEFELNNKRSYSNNRPCDTPKLPELFYIPKVTNWLKTKMKLRYLKQRFDPDFTEGAFIYGSQIALCRITEIINERQFDDLDNLVTSNVKAYVKNLIDTKKLTSLQIDMIRLRPDDIKLMVPLKVKFERTGDNYPASQTSNQILCKIMLKSLSMKWYKYNDNLKLILIVIESEFQRKFDSFGKEHDWIIGQFEVKQCSMLTGTSIH